MSSIPLLQQKSITTCAQDIFGSADTKYIASQTNDRAKRSAGGFLVGTIHLAALT
jgi:hypothetical protein